MAEKKSKIGFGSKEDIETAILSQLVDEYDILCLDNGELGWINANKQPVINTPRIQNAIQVKGVENLGVANGETLNADTTLEEVVKKLVQKRIAPTYVAPIVTLTKDEGPSTGSVESGTSTSLTLTATYKQNDAGDLTQVEILKNDVQVCTDSTYTEDDLVIGDEDITYVAKVTYEEGQVKNDNLGEPYSEGHIIAGSVMSDEYVISGKRNAFYGYGAGTVDEITSTVVRGLANKKLDPQSGDIITFTVASGSQYILFCLPDPKELASISYDNMNDKTMLSSFTKSTVQVADARGGDNGLKNYNCYLMNLAVATPAPMTFTFVIA